MSDTIHALRIVVPESPDDPTPLAAMRLGAYRSFEDDWIDTSLSLADGFYLMTNAQTTTNVDGNSYVYAGQGMLIDGDKSITIKDAGETSVRAHSVAFASGCNPDTSDDYVSLDATDDVTMQSATDISITCENLVYVVEEHYHGSTASDGTEISQGEISVNVGDTIYICAMADIDIATVGFEPIAFEHSCAVFSISSSGLEMSDSKFEMENHGFRAFLVGLFVPFSAAEAEEVAASNHNSSVAVRDRAVSLRENAAANDTNAVAVRARALSCKF
ncbi:hypothetical protein [Amorphus orientalis]|uniref:Uncharacterized protein n=1 Tax=Amorphus orientalis TaxID=649198 RepID=A0AAE3VRH8_9HYPH|nr:hypothetical protein [Amorphus orientalis]MDQ0317424.1 hypothetical protein [Amorphus orientalis]